MKKNPSFHSRNRHQGRYEFDCLLASSPELEAFILLNPSGERTIDFANPDAVKALNRALLKDQYKISDWDIPPGFLCPPVPGRADYIHAACDLLVELTGETARGSEVRVIDIGVGANCIYPFIGHFEYGWSFVGVDIDREALASCRRILKANPHTKKAIELRLQESPSQLFSGVVKKSEKFHLSISNPPFYASMKEAQEKSNRKWRNLGRKSVSNFGGRSSELCTDGGERGFIIRMIQESVLFAHQIRCFTVLVSNRDSLEGVYRALKVARVADFKTVEMAQGQKVSRIVAWTFGIQD